MNRSRPIIQHRDSGYEAYKDELPKTGVKWRAVLTLVGVIFFAGVLCAGVSFVVFRALSPGTPQVIQTSTETPTPDITETTSNVIISTALPTETPTPSVTPTATNTEIITPSITPTPEVLSTLEALRTQVAIQQTFDANRLALTATYQAIQDLIITPETTEPVTSYTGQYAVVMAEPLIVRSGRSVNHRALDLLEYGERFEVIEFRGDWIRINHPDHNEAWVAGWLVRIESP